MSADTVALGLLDDILANPADDTPRLIYADCCRDAYSFRNYIGESTRREIAYAVSLGKPVRYLSQEGER